MSTSRNIFVIDDDGDFVSLLTEILTQAGYQVQSSTQPLEALQTIQNQQFDLLILDQRMGPTSGSELLVKIRQANPTIPVIVISGFLEHASTQQFINLGVSGIFFKPLNIFALLKRVEELFKGAVKASGTMTADAGIRGFTKTPFGSSAIREVFFKKLQALAAFKGNLLLVGDSYSPFNEVAQEIVKKSPGEKLVNWELRFSDPGELAKNIKGAAQVTFFIQGIGGLTENERSAFYKIAKHEKPFESLPPIRFIFCLDQDLDTIYESHAVDDEFYLFLGNLELKLPKAATPQNLHKKEGLQRAAQAISGSSAPFNKTGRVLVLDDEDLHAQMIVDLLDSNGYKALKIISPAEALVALRKERFSLIITDFRMPGINGIDFVSQARAIEPSIPIFIVTGNIQLPEMVRIGNMGITRLIQKPVEMEKFLAEVKKIISA